VPTKVGLEVDDPDGIGTDVNEVNDSGDGDLLTVNSEWQIRILLNSQLTIERVYERLDVTFIVVRGLDILFQDVPLSELVSPRSERCPSPVIDVLEHIVTHERVRRRVTDWTIRRRHTAICKCACVVSSISSS